RGVLLSILKNGGASTLDIVSNLRDLLPRVARTLPDDVEMVLLFDQSLFVKAAIKGVISEALIAAALTAAMVLLFLGNWRTTLIIALTIPLSILASILTLQILGETLNLMTLGGLALSVGILVDQAIVTLVRLLMRKSHAPDARGDSLLQRLYRSFDQRFEHVRRNYTLVLSVVLTHRAMFASVFMAFCVLSCLLYPVLGRDFFPTVDAGQ